MQLVSNDITVSNAPSQSSQSAYRLGPSVSLDRGASRLVVGEYVLVRIPERIQVDEYVENEATAIGTNLPPASTGSGPQHFAFIRDVHLLPGRSWMLEVYPVLFFANAGGALPTYNRMTDTTKAALLPLPPLSSRHPTPSAFGAPLDFGNWSTYRYSFLHVFPRRFTMTLKRINALIDLVAQLGVNDPTIHFVAVVPEGDRVEFIVSKNRGLLLQMFCIEVTENELYD